jgi:hypothetical protein
MAKQRHSKKVEHWDDERHIGNSLIVTLKDGWRFTFDGEHVRGFDTVKEANCDVRRAVPCRCKQCVPNQGY